MKKYDVKKILKVTIPVLIALFSILVLTRMTASPGFHSKTIESLDKKKTTVMELTAASTATSVAISFLPNDTASPVASKITDLSSYFLLVLCAIYLEKYILTITGYAAFGILIPVACILYALNVFVKEKSWNHMARRLSVFGLALFLVVPASVKVSDKIEETYQYSIDNTLASAKQTITEIEDTSNEEEENILSGLLSKITDGVSGITAKVNSVLNNFIEALAVLIVTSCVIPIIVLAFFGWIIKRCIK